MSYDIVLVLGVNEYLNAVIILQLSIKLPLLGGIKRGTANMRVPVSGRRFPEEAYYFSPWRDVCQN
jgi:hypothetical protein